MKHTSIAVFLLIACVSAQSNDCNQRGTPQLDGTCKCFPPFAGQRCELFTSPLVCESIGNDMFTLKPPTYGLFSIGLSEKECNTLQITANSIICGNVFACFRQIGGTFTLYYDVSTTESTEDAVRHLNDFFAGNDGTEGSGEDDNSTDIIFIQGIIVSSIDLTFDQCTELSQMTDISNSDFTYPCDYFPCQHGGICENVNAVDFKCKCRGGWKGDTCDEKNVCSLKGYGKVYCKNGGQCSYNGNLPVCQCRKGWMGTRCNVKNYCDQTVPYCQNGGKCKYSNSKPVCECAQGFYGEKCVCAKSNMTTQGQCLAKTDCPKKTKPQFYKETRNGCKNECRCVKK